jgi:hypothetical protein
MWPAHQGLKPLATNARPPGDGPRRLTLDTEYGVKGRRAGACGSGERSALGSGGAVDDGSAAQAEACGSGERSAPGSSGAVDDGSAAQAEAW